MEEGGGSSDLLRGTSDGPDSASSAGTAIPGRQQQPADPEPDQPWAGQCVNGSSGGGQRRTAGRRSGATGGPAGTAAAPAPPGSCHHPRRTAAALPTSRGQSALGGTTATLRLSLASERAASLPSTPLRAVHAKMPGEPRSPRDGCPVYGLRCWESRAPTRSPERTYPTKVKTVAAAITAPPHPDAQWS